MDSRTLERPVTGDAAEFVRFCYGRRRVGWPELYDEMCAVANRGLYHGWGTDELNSAGIGFSLFEMPALAALVGRVIAEEQQRRLIARAAIAEAARSAPSMAAAPAAPAAPAAARFQPVVDRTAERGSERAGDVSLEAPVSLRFAGATAGA